MFIDCIAIRLSDLRKFKGSLVYMVMREGKIIYVGRSNVGIDRPLEKSHSALSQCLGSDIVRLEFCKSASIAARRERELIRDWNPPLNVRKPEHQNGVKFKK